MTNRGRRRAESKLSERLTITMNAELRQALEARSDRDDAPMGEIARKLLEEQLLQRGEQEERAA